MKHETDQEKMERLDKEACARTRLRGVSRSFNVRQQIHQHNEDVESERRRKARQREDEEND